VTMNVNPPGNSGEFNILYSNRLQTSCCCIRKCVLYVVLAGCCYGAGKVQRFDLTPIFPSDIPGIVRLSPLININQQCEIRK
jgi:hypothetical protein